MAVLEMKKINKSFFGKKANDNVNLTVSKGEIHALLGENGAGKTTLMNILYGIYQKDEGEIRWKGEPIAFQSPAEAIKCGIGMVHQHFSLIKNMTVLENIVLGLKQEHVFLPKGEVKAAILKLVEDYGLEVAPDAIIKDLSVGEQQRVEIIKALYRKAELLILDEPTGVLTPAETRKFFGVLQKLKCEGHAIVIITHRMSEIMEISDRVTILRDGKMVKELVTADTNPEELSAYMIGRQLAEKTVISECKKGKPVLVMEQVGVKKRNRPAVLDDISLALHEGEIVGVAGVDGNGQKELAEVIAGIRRNSTGKIRFCGEVIDKESVADRFKRGISYISDDRHNDGLVMDMNLKENMLLRNYKDEPYSRLRVFKDKPGKAYAEEAVTKFQIKMPGIDKSVRLLSGGNQQKIILAREITEHSKCIIANQPTRGLDIGATEFVRTLLRKQRDMRKCVLLISADLEEIMELSDRIAVMFAGKIVGILNQKEAEIEKIGLLMGGIEEAAGNE